MVRAASLRGLPALVEELGGDAATVLERCQVNPGVLESEDAVLRAVTVQRLLVTAARAVGRGDIGLLLAARQDLDHLGPLAVAVQAATTLGQALDAAVRFLYVQCPLALRVDPDPHGDPRTIAVAMHPVTARGYHPQGLELALGQLHRALATLCGEAYAARSVHLAHEAQAPMERYVEFFGAEVQTQRPHSLIRLWRDLLDAPLPGGNANVHTLAVRHLEATYPAPRAGVTDRVRRVLDDSLGTVALTVEWVAGTLLMHPRTLQRHLAAEGTTFEGILDDVRRRIARRMIIETDLPLRLVAEKVGLAEHAVLTRAVRRWFGLTPSALRRSRPEPEPEPAPPRD